MFELETHREKMYRDLPDVVWEVLEAYNLEIWE
jgi:hypothetical protein